jgi:hypothetical protein
MNPTGISAFNQARIEWAIRLKYSPLPSLDMEMLGSQLNQFRIGELRQIGKTWEVMMERDAELAVNSDKRKADASGLEWQVVSDGSLAGDQHAAALQYFYDNAVATKALDQDSTGGTDELIYQVMSSLDYYYSIHEMLLRIDNPAAKEITAEFRHAPIWFFEARRGYLGYLQHIFDVYGQPLLAGEWLSCVNLGWMRPLTMAYAAKWYSMTDWLIFCRRYGSGFLEGITDAQKDSTEWNAAADALTSLANDGVVLHNGKGSGNGAGVEFKFLEQAAKNQLPFQPVVESIDRLYAKCYRGVDMATGSRASHGAAGAGGGQQGSKNPVGASVQKEESGIFLVRDAKFVTGVFNDRIDRPIIRYLFKQEPRAWFALVPPLEDNSQSDLLSAQALVPMGLRIALKEAYKRFRWSVPERGEPCLEAPAAAPSGAATGEDDDEDNFDADGNKKPKAPATPAPEKAAPVLPEEKPKVDDGKTQPAMTDENTPIGAGADPAKQIQAADPRMPGTQIDAAGFWSNAGQSRLKNGRPIPVDSTVSQNMPSLGYAIPNERLAFLTAHSLGNSRAAQSLRRQINAVVRDQVALANAAGSLEASGKKLIIEAILAEFNHINERMAAIADIKDVDVQKQKLAAVLADLDKLEASLNHDPQVAQAIYKILAAGVANGVSTAATERKSA